MAMAMAMWRNSSTLLRAGASSGLSAPSRRLTHFDTKQTSDQVLMVSSDRFRVPGETKFEHPVKPITPEVAAMIQLEYQGMKKALMDAGVSVLEHVSKNPNDEAADAIVPEKWVSTHRSFEGVGSHGVVILYPLHPSHRGERDPELVQLLEDRYPVVEDLSDNENHGEYLEGTASVVMDRIASKLFMTRSPLSSEKMCHELGLHLDRLGVGGENPAQCIIFDSVNKLGKTIHTTNYMMMVGTSLAIVCSDAITDSRSRDLVLSTLREHREVMEITLDQMDAFCAQVFEVSTRHSDIMLVMSSRSKRNFTTEQMACLKRHYGNKILDVKLDTIEEYGLCGASSLVCLLF